MSEKGAYSGLHIYSQDNIAQVIEFARECVIRVFMEFDSPRHTKMFFRISMCI
jgi:N-acetyl-beta-hexosaminidase